MLLESQKKKKKKIPSTAALRGVSLNKSLKLVFTQSKLGGFKLWIKTFEANQERSLWMLLVLTFNSYNFKPHH